MAQEYRMLRKNGKGNPFPWTEALAARSDMVEVMMTAAQVRGEVGTEVATENEPHLDARAEARAAAKLTAIANLEKATAARREQGRLKREAAEMKNAVLSDGAEPPVEVSGTLNPDSTTTDVKKNLAAPGNDEPPDQQSEKATST
jgi:hypothetical protein